MLACRSGRRPGHASCPASPTISPPRAPPPPAELAAANQALSPEQIEARIAELEGKQAAAEAKLQGLRGGGARLVSSTDVEKVEKVRGSEGG